MNSLTQTAKNTLKFKSFVRGLWSGYFNFRYLASTSVKTHGPVFGYSFNRWRNVTSPLLFEDSKFIELFESASKSKFIAASLLSCDITELSTNIDSFKEGYPFTAAFATFNKILSQRDQYTVDLEGPYLDEVENCFEDLEKYCKVYTTMFQMASMSEEIRNVILRAYTQPKKRTFKHLLSANYYDSEDRLHNDLKKLLGNYKRIVDDLKDFPMWREKFETDVIKLFSFNNTLFDSPEIYEFIDKQRIFK